MGPAFVHVDIAATTVAGAFGGVVCKVDIVTVIHIEKIAIAEVGIAVQVDDVVAYNDRFFFRSRAGS